MKYLVIVTLLAGLLGGCGKTKSKEEVCATSHGGLCDAGYSYVCSMGGEIYTSNSPCPAPTPSN